MEMPVELRSLVSGSDINEFLENMESLKNVFDTWYKQKLNAHMQQTAGQPISTTVSSQAQQPSIAGNPFIEGTPDYNFTEQMRLYKEDRSEYDRLKKEADELKLQKQYNRS